MPSERPSWRPPAVEASRTCCYDRLKDAAVASGWQVKDLLALVIAHELAHLLLPPGSHTSDGLMRSGWDVAELRHIHLSSLAFTPDNVTAIRKRLAQMVTRIRGQA